jgi:hypothetical protein
MSSKVRTINSLSPPLAELCSLIALGLLRLCDRQSSELLPDAKEIQLSPSSEQSGYAASQPESLFP